MKIPILHLDDGIHYFDFLVKGGSLHFYRDAIYPEDLIIQVEVNKFEKNITCKLDMETTGHYTCDRCLNNYNRPFVENFELLFHMGKNDLITDEENVINLPVDTVDIDLTQWVTEYLILAIPMKMLCKEDCKGICSGCGAELNKEACTCEKTEIDPRLEKLRELLKS